MSIPGNSNTPSPSAPAGSAADPHDVDWEARYQAGDMPWEKGYAAPPLVDWLQTHSLPGKVLVPGCGAGHDVRAIARTGSTVIGLDLAPSAINLADAQPRVGTERYRLANFFELPPELVGQFDWIFEHTLFCAITPARRQAYVNSAAAALAPGGRLLAIFYLDPGPDREGPPFGVSRDELHQLFSPRFELIEESTPSTAYPGREGREIIHLLQLSS